MKKFSEAKKKKIILEAKKRLEEDNVEKDRIKQIETWIKFAQSEIPEFAEKNIILLDKWLNEKHEKGIDYDAIAKKTTSFIKKNKSLDDNIVNLLNECIKVITDKASSNIEKKNCLDKIDAIMLNIHYKEIALELFSYINLVPEEKDKILALIKILNDDNLSLDNRKQAYYDALELIKGLKDFVQIYNVNKLS